MDDGKNASRNFNLSIRVAVPVVRQDDRVDAIAELGFQTNWFRILGLPADATQADIDAAARKMRLWKDPARIPPTEWDFPGWDRMDRGRSSIEPAVAALADPSLVRLQASAAVVLRARDAAGAHGRVGRLNARRRRFSRRRPMRDRHEAGLLSLLAAARVDPRMIDGRRWVELAGTLCGSARSPQTWSVAAPMRGSRRF